MKQVICMMVTEDSEFSFDNRTENNLNFLSQQFGTTVTLDNIEQVLDKQVELFNCSEVDMDHGDPVTYIQSTNSPENHG